jgi:hypothetical protein
MRISLVILSLLFSLIAHALENKETLSKSSKDLLALQSKNFPCQKVIEELSSGTTLTFGFLWRSFGENESCLKRIFEIKKPITFRVHLLNGVCHRRDNCEAHELPLKAGIIESEIIKFEEFLAKILAKRGASDGEVTCLLSPILEHDLNDKRTLAWFSRFSKVLRKCKLVNNPAPPYGKERFLGNSNLQAIDEFHLGETPPPEVLDYEKCILSLDGNISIPSAILMERYAKKCFLIFEWVPSYNCLTEGMAKGVVKSPPLRERKDCRS